MSYISLYRKWRPQVFEDVVEQEHVVRTLRNSVISGRIAHAYLFCGTRGTGKTTMAHILARAINCLDPVNGDPCNRCEICTGILDGSILDVIEIDAASNNSVDNVREIRDEVVYAPSRAKYKVYIIDEVHMLSTGAFNALLKTLEEPPPHVVFILATTEPHRLPATILSRCQRFDFRRISAEGIVARLHKIAAANGITLDADAAGLIAKLSDGALRDAISLLDQCIAPGNEVISYNDVLSVAGMVNDDFMADLADFIINRDTVSVLNAVSELVAQGKDTGKFIGDMILYFRNMLVCKVASSPEKLLELRGDVIERLKKQSEKLDHNLLISIIRDLSECEANLKWSAHPRILLEATLIKLSEMNLNIAENDVLTRLARLEHIIERGALTGAAGAAGETQKGGADSRPESPNETAGIEREPAGDDKSGYNAENNKSVQIDGAKSKNSKKTAAQEFQYRRIPEWDQVVTDIKNSGRMAIYLYLVGTYAVELGTGAIGVVFTAENRTIKDYFTKTENLDVVKEAASRRLGRTVRVKFIDEEDISGIKEEKPDTRDEVEEKLKDIARRHNVPLEVVE